MIILLHLGVWTSAVKKRMNGYIYLIINIVSFFDMVDMFLDYQCFCSLWSKSFSLCDVFSQRHHIFRLWLHLSLQWINLRAVAEVSILSGFPEASLFGQRRLGCPGSCVMDGGIKGPSDRGIIAAAPHQWDLSPSRLPVNYVSSCLVCSCGRSENSGALLWCG